MRLGQVLKELVEHDVNLGHILATGEWTTIFVKKNFAVMEDNMNKRTLVIQLKAIPIYNKNMEVKYYSKEVDWYIIHRKLTPIEVKELYEKFRKNKIKMIPIRQNRHRIKLGRKAKKLDDNTRLKINMERQRYIEEKLNELEEEYSRIKYKRKEPFKSRKKKLKELIEDYRRLLKELKEAEKILRQQLRQQLPEEEDQKYL